MKKVIVAAVLGLMMFSCKENKEYIAYLHDPNLYCETVHELNTVVMGNNFPPIIASRNYTYAALAAYEAMAAGNTKEYNSLAGQINGFKTAVKPQSDKIDFDLAALLAYMKVGSAVTFPEGSMDEYRKKVLDAAIEKGLPDEVLESSQVFADSVSAAIIRWAKDDMYAATRGSTKYTVLDSPGRWVPTPPMYAEAMEPNWNKIRPLVMTSCDQFMAPRPLPFNITDTSSAYYKEVMAVKNAGDSLTEEQKHIANFWDDNPFKLNVSGHVMYSTKKFSPPGHWMGIVGIAAEKAKLDFAGTVYAYAITAIASFDAFIQCWDEKYRSKTARPETVINKYIDPNWRPLLQTPPFPEYTCGHSTVSSAAAEAMTSVFGDNFAYTDTTELEFGIPSRSYTSFRHAADENNWARFYGGIHFHHSCIVSTEFGRKVGQYVVENLKLKKNT